MASDLADYLEGLGLVTKTGPGRDVFQSKLEDVGTPDDAVLLVEGGGRSADRSNDGRRDLNIGVAITVRAATDQFVAGYQRARNIYDAMLDLVNVGINGTVYKGAVPLGDVSDLGRDENKRYKWSMSFVVKNS